MEQQRRTDGEMWKTWAETDLQPGKQQGNLVPESWIVSTAVAVRKKGRATKAVHWRRLLGDGVKLDPQER